MNKKTPLRSQSKKFLRNIYWGLYGKTINNPSLPVYPKYLLFLCKGNICRSPFAEHLARKMLLERGIEGVSADSAGFEAVDSNLPPVEAVRSALRFGISLDSHRAKALNGPVIERADMVLVMEVAQMQQFAMDFPIEKAKVFLLPLFYDGPIHGFSKYIQYNVPDPYGQVDDKFFDCYEQIHHCLHGLVFSIYKNV